MDDQHVEWRSRSPWIEQLDPDALPCPLVGDRSTDVAIIGAGIAGVSTAFFVLRDTDRNVMLIERDRAGCGATGHNAGQLATYFERPLIDLVDEYGFERAIAAQAAIESAVELLDQMLRESEATVRIERIIGHMGMFSLDHLRVHLSNQLIRRRGGLPLEACVVADDAPFLDDLADEYSSLYSVVSRARVRELLGTTSDRYCAVLSAPRACANSALLVEQVLAYLRARYVDRFEYVDHTLVARIVVDGDGAVLDASGHRVHASEVVLCTNGFVDHVVVDEQDEPIVLPDAQRITQTVGFMAGVIEHEPRTPGVMSFIRNERIGEDTPYAYVTRRTYEGPSGDVTLTCFGGPEVELDDDDRYDAAAPYPAATLDEVTRHIRPLVDLRTAGSTTYDYAWHGVMAYTPSRVRIVGRHRRHPSLLYNTACNGVGFLPSVYGGFRIARLVDGEHVEPSIFDPG